MVRHSAAVARGADRALVVTDMPYLSYQITAEDAVRNAGRLVRDGGAQAVKLEGGAEFAQTVARIVSTGIPVVGHLGMTPQSVNRFGGYATQGTDPASAEHMAADALALQEAGVCAIVLEKVPADLAARLTKTLEIPTIGIGAGPDCDGQVLVTHDILGLYDRFTPPFAKQYANLWRATVRAFKTYDKEVKNGEFPRRAQEDSCK